MITERAFAAFQVRLLAWLDDECPEFHTAEGVLVGSLEQVPEFLEEQEATAGEYRLIMALYLGRFLKRLDGNTRRAILTAVEDRCQVTVRMTH